MALLWGRVLEQHRVWAERTVLWEDDETAKGRVYGRRVEEDSCTALVSERAEVTSSGRALEGSREFASLKSP